MYRISMDIASVFLLCFEDSKIVILKNLNRKKVFFAPTFVQSVTLKRVKVILRQYFMWAFEVKRVKGPFK